MKQPWKQIFTAVVLSSSLLAAGVPALADEAQPAVSASAIVRAYTLTDSLQFEVEGVLNEKNSSGVRLGAVIRITNTSDRTIRIPDHELRVKTAEGVVYTLKASSGNVHGVQPQSKVELTYLKQVDRQTEAQLSELSLVDVDYQVYPKRETNFVTIPVSAITWNGSRSVLKDSSLVKSWKDAFTIPSLESPLIYTPDSITKTYTASGTSFLVKLLVENPSDQTETVPAIELDGRTATSTYAGKQAEAVAVSLDPGEKKYVHFVIPADLDTTLESINVLTTSVFTQTNAAGLSSSSSFTVGKLNILISSANVSESTGSAYTFGSPIVFEKWNDVINPNLNVSLVELHVTDNEEGGYKTGLAKFKLINKGEKPIPVPVFQTELTSKDGFAYSGNRQNLATQDIAPGTGIVVSYGYVLPTSEQGDQFTLNVQGLVQGSNGTAPSSYKSTIASCPVIVQGEEDLTKLSFYPFTVNVKDWSLTQTTMPGSTNAFVYTYKLQINLNIDRDAQVIVDNSFSKMKIELIDANGSSLGFKSFPFTGANRLVSGRQDLNFDNLSADQIENKVAIKIYETISTPTGDVDRLIKVLNQ